MVLFKNRTSDGKIGPCAAIAGAAAAVVFGMSACSTTGTDGDGGQMPEEGASQDLNLVEPGKLNIANISGQVPIAYVDSDGKPAGFGNDLLRHIAEENLGVEPVITTGTVPSSLSGLKLGTYDIGSAAGVYLPERLEEYSTSIPWYWASSYVVQSGESDYAVMEDLKGKRVGVVEASAQARTIEDYSDIETVTFESQTAELAALKGGQIDAVLLGGENAIAVTEDDDGLRLGAEIESSHPSGFFGAKDNEELMNAIDEGIKKSMEDGTFMELWDKHVDHPVNEKIMEKYPALEDS